MNIAEVLAFQLRRITRVQIAILGVIGDGSDSHDARNVFPQDRDFLARVLIRSENGMADPVGPEDVFSKHGDIKRMLRMVSQ